MPRKLHRNSFGLPSVRRLSFATRTRRTAVNKRIHPLARIGHVHLKVSDVAKSEDFYARVLGYETTMRGDGLVFMSAGGYHHHLALNSKMSEGKEPPPEGAPGLLHFAILFPEHGDLAAAARRAMDEGVVFHRASDYGYSVAVYMKDPDGNEVELSWDRDPRLWPRDETGALRRRPQRITVEEALRPERPSLDPSAGQA